MKNRPEMGGSSVYLQVAANDGGDMADTVKDYLVSPYGIYECEFTPQERRRYERFKAWVIIVCLGLMLFVLLQRAY